MGNGLGKAHKLLGVGLELQTLTFFRFTQAYSRCHGYKRGGFRFLGGSVSFN